MILSRDGYKAPARALEVCLNPLGRYAKLDKIGNQVLIWSANRVETCKSIEDVTNGDDSDRVFQTTKRDETD